MWFFSLLLFFSWTLQASDLNPYASPQFQGSERSHAGAAQPCAGAVLEMNGSDVSEPRDLAKWLSGYLQHFTRSNLALYLLLPQKPAKYPPLLVAEMPDGFEHREPPSLPRALFEEKVSALDSVELLINGVGSTVVSALFVPLAFASAWGATFAEDSTHTLICIALAFGGGYAGWNLSRFAWNHWRDFCTLGRYRPGDQRTSIDNLLLHSSVRGSGARVLLVNGDADAFVLRLMRSGRYRQPIYYLP